MAETPPKIDFQDTRLAFSHMSDKALKRRYRLFKMIDSPFLTKIGPPTVTFSLKAGLPVIGMIRTTIFDIFCGGTSLPDTVSRSELLFGNGVKTILDYSVEGEKTDAGFDATRDEIIRTLEHGAKHEAVGFSAMKVTGIASFDLLARLQAGAALTNEEKASLDRARQRMEAICKRACELKQPVFVDAEETWIQDVIDQWTEEMMEKYNQDGPFVYTTLQFYRWGRVEYLKELIEKARQGGFILGVKTVRGAYLEKERERAAEKGYKDPIQKDKAATDRDFNLALQLCSENPEVTAICCGTHNEQSSLHLANLMEKAGLPHNHPHFLFAQLLGMSDNISFNLAHHGYNVAKYLPYGPVRAVLPYLFRRADENTAIGGQSSREVSLLRKEVRRRKGKVG
ncbi:MAG: proline dehydrogenase family protein [Bacteroidia bacterium]|nr:proline dehydrogenase family protein [Bacteroidia bacterium]